MLVAGEEAQDIRYTGYTPRTVLYAVVHRNVGTVESREFVVVVKVLDASGVSIPVLRLDNKVFG